MCVWIFLVLICISLKIMLCTFSYSIPYIASLRTNFLHKFCIVFINFMFNNSFILSILVLCLISALILSSSSLWPDFSFFILFYFICLFIYFALVIQIIYFLNYFIFVQLQLSALSPHFFPHPSQLHLPPLLPPSPLILSTCPL